MPGAETSGLAAAPTAFLRAQAASPVHWEPWNDATLARARQSGRCVYVFVGTSLSELTRATLRQTFASAKTAAWLNGNFFCILVDADAQPEVAAYAQHFIRTAKQLQGLPVHLWLTPELQPYDGANYLPPSEEWGQPGFLKAARSALDSWTSDPARTRALAAEAKSLMRVPPLDQDTKTDGKARLDRAATAWIAALDPVHGGFGTAPKNPEPEVIRFLLQRDEAGRNAALAAARALVNGAVCDPVDGGFHRRASDEAWKEPYRQKTLADQARIALALLEAGDSARDDKLRTAAFRALDFTLRELRNPDGTFAAALDGTLEENGDPAKRPAFVRTGIATSEALGLLISALQRAGEKRFGAAASQLAAGFRRELSIRDHTLAHIAGLPAVATAADYAAVALAFRSLGDNVTADSLLARANEFYFDPASGSYLASTTQPPAAITVRVPASAETMPPEVLALLAGVDENSARLIRRGLLGAIEYDERPPGAVLLGLATSR